LELTRQWPLVFIALLGAQAMWGHSLDVCEQKVPAPLRRVLSAKFPGFRPARFADQTGDVAEFNKRSGGDGCITVAVGDFDGDGQMDVALLLTNPKSDVVRLVVALRRATSWATYRLPIWCRPISACYVQTTKPGLFRRSEALDTPLSSRDERNQIESQTESVISGTLEATGIVCVYAKEKWHYVWVSD
jgi:hypothetical protein